MTEVEPVEMEQIRGSAIRIVRLMGLMGFISPMSPK